MHEWTMAHPYLTFTLALFGILMLNNIIMGLIKSDDAKTEDKKSDIDTSSARKQSVKKDNDKETDTEYN